MVLMQSAGIEHGNSELLQTDANPRLGHHG
jgi:hypothetical protein